MTSEAVLQSLRVLAEAAREHRITLAADGELRINGAPTNPFQQLAVSVLDRWGWITWTPSLTCYYAVLTEHGKTNLAIHAGPDFSDGAQWRAFEHHMFEVSVGDLTEADTDTHGDTR
jgi:hypothetical protein